MARFPFPMTVLAVSLVAAAPIYAQTLSQSNPATMQASQKTDGEAPTPIGSGSGAYRQKTDGEAPTVIGSGSKAFSQKTDGEAPTVIGSGSGAYRQKTDGEAPTVIGSGSRAFSN